MTIDQRKIDFTFVLIFFSGAFATVKLCINKATNVQYAMKIIEKKKFALNHGTKRANALMVKKEQNY
jgi:hypothetical protein